MFFCSSKSEPVAPNQVSSVQARGVAVSTQAWENLESTLSGFENVTTTLTETHDSNYRDAVTNVEGRIERHQINDLIRTFESSQNTGFSIRAIQRASRYFSNARFDILLSKSESTTRDCENLLMVTTKVFNFDLIDIEFSELVLLLHICDFNFCITRISSENSIHFNGLSKHLALDENYSSIQLKSIIIPLVRNNFDLCLKILALMGVCQHGKCSINFLNSTRKALFNADVISEISSFLIPDFPFKRLSLFGNQVKGMPLVNPVNEEENTGCII